MRWIAYGGLIILLVVFSSLDSNLHDDLQSSFGEEITEMSDLSDVDWINPPEEHSKIEEACMIQRGSKIKLLHAIDYRGYYLVLITVTSVPKNFDSTACPSGSLLLMSSDYWFQQADSYRNASRGAQELPR
jgi:hypothetical protein